MRDFVLVLCLAALSGCFSDPGPEATSEDDESSSADTGDESSSEESSETGEEEESSDSESGMDVPTDMPPDDDSNWALSFDGNDSAVSAIVDVGLAAAFTVELWVRFDVEEHYGILVDSRAEGVKDRGWSFYIDPPSGAFAGHLVFYYYASNESGHYVVGPDMNELEGWHHVAVVRKSSGATDLYVDGVSTATKNLPEPPGQGSAKVFVGRHHGAAPEADSWWRGGVLDDIHVSDGDRYSEDFVPEQAVADGSSVFLWAFNEGQGVVTYDVINDIPLALDNPEWVFVD